ncbi:MAG: DUF1987 domain-containing protein [Brumimicrobium sp.]|nr:DUF1987 domain-containing protein [Brumimicrobium sp.]
MENLELKATAKTPLISFSAETGKMIIQGRAIPDNSEDFWKPVLQWFYAYSTDPQPVTLMVFDMEYFNISSSKPILFLLHKMNDLMEDGREVKIEWRYPKGDQDMLETGNDYSTMVKIPFTFKESESNYDLAV